jgi:hypothetical protein
MMLALWKDSSLAALKIGRKVGKEFDEAETMSSMEAIAAKHRTQFSGTGEVLEDVELNSDGNSRKTVGKTESVSLMDKTLNTR